MKPTYDQLLQANETQQDTIKRCWYRESKLKRQVEALRRENERLMSQPQHSAPQVSEAVKNAEQFFKDAGHE